MKEKKQKLTRQEKKAIKKAKKAELKAKGQTFWSDFKKFISKGNVIDMAVGVVIGAAFKEIITQFVNVVINPLIGLLTGDAKLSDLNVVLKPGDEAAGIEALTLDYGIFLQAIFDFLLIAFCIFLALRIISGFRTRVAVAAEKLVALAKKEEEESAEPAPAVEEPAPAPVPVKTAEERIEELLVDIRDSLKTKESKKKKVEKE